MLLVNGVLLARPLHSNLHRHGVLIDLELPAVGLEARGNDLQAHCVTDGNHVDYGFAIEVTLQFHDALVSVALDGVEDDSGMLDRLAIGIPNHADFNARGRWRNLVLAAAALVILRAGME